MPSPLLAIQDLAVRYRTRRGVVPALRGVSLTVERGETVGIVGESGSGKSTLALALLRLLPGNVDSEGNVLLDGSDLLALSDGEMRRRSGRHRPR